jgi:hypothetical protein
MFELEKATEEAIRDSERLRVIESLAMNDDVMFTRELVLAICGYIKEAKANGMSV